MDASRLEFLDETGTAPNSPGRDPRGERLVDATPHGDRETTTFVAGLRSRDLTAPLALDRPMTGEVFQARVRMLSIGDREGRSSAHELEPVEPDFERCVLRGTCSDQALSRESLDNGTERGSAGGFNHDHELGQEICVRARPTFFGLDRACVSLEPAQMGAVYTWKFRKARKHSREITFELVGPARCSVTSDCDHCASNARPCGKFCSTQ